MHDKSLILFDPMHSPDALADPFQLVQLTFCKPVSAIRLCLDSFSASYHPLVFFSRSYGPSQYLSTPFNPPHSRYDPGANTIPFDLPNSRVRRHFSSSLSHAPRSVVWNAILVTRYHQSLKEMKREAYQWVESAGCTLY